MNEINRELEAKGVSHVRGLLDANELLELRSEITRMLSNVDDLSGDMQTKADDNGDIREISGLAKNMPLFSDSAAFRTCHEFACDIFKTRARYGHDEVIFKAPGSKPVDWHQDQFYSKYDKDKQCVSIWIPLQKTDAANGGMEYVVDNADGLLQHDPVSVESFMYRISESQVKDATKFSPSMELGDVCVHTPMSVHRSHPNSSGEERIAWILQFNKYGASRFFRWSNVRQYLPGSA